MEMTKQKIYNRLSSLNQISFSKPTAMNLHSQINPLRNRVQRKENNIYRKKVELQKERLNTSLGKINTYELELRAERERRAAILAEYEKLLLVKSKDPLVKDPIVPSAPIFSPLSTTVPKPIITIGPTPVLRRVRF